MNIKPFVSVALAWALLAGIGIGVFDSPRAAGAFILIWGCSLLDLGSLLKLGETVFALVLTPREFHRTLVIRASYWGFLKLVSWGIFAMALPIHWPGLAPGAWQRAQILGLVTLAVVPLAGGVWWNRRQTSRIGLMGSPMRAKDF